MSGNDWLLWAFLSACFAALTAIFTKIGLEGIDPDQANLIRTAFILMAVTLFVTFTGKWSNPLHYRGHTWLYLGLSALAAGASWVCYFRALKVGAVSQVAPIDKLSVVIATLFAVIFLGERPVLREWAGIALISAGAVLLALKR